MPKSTILVGDVLTRLAELPDESVQMVVTSPPYWGLRDYGTGQWEGGNADCDHIAPPTGGPSEKGQRGKFSADGQYKSICGKCQAKRVDSQLGLEATPEEYVENMVAVFREVRRVLKPNGTLWLNIGDSYFTKPKSNYGDKSDNDLQAKSYGTGETGLGYRQRADHFKNLIASGYKNKDLVGIPWRVAFALQADGWYLRSDIIWHKPNPMPEAVRDRPTKSHEHLFLLAKSSRYFYDYEGAKEEGVMPAGYKAAKGSAKRYAMEGVNARPPGYKVYDGKRNRRDVWTVHTKPFRGAHFAVMPEALVEPCVLAGSAEGDLVLDPFTGSGTVAVVSNRLKRDFIGTELNSEYAEIAQKRISDADPLFNTVTVVENLSTDEAALTSRNEADE